MNFQLTTAAVGRGGGIEAGANDSSLVGFWSLMTDADAVLGLPVYANMGYSDVCLRSALRDKNTHAGCIATRKERRCLYGTGRTVRFLLPSKDFGNKLSGLSYRDDVAGPDHTRTGNKIWWW